VIHRDWKWIMGQSYSMDLRERIVASVNAGLSRREVARQFDVSDSCAVKLLQRVAATGSAAPARQGRPPAAASSRHIATF
jgi:transposase